LHRIFARSENARGGVSVKKVVALLVLLGVLGAASVAVAGPHDIWPPTMTVAGTSPMTAR
jgi:hypothetical protein